MGEVHWKPKEDLESVKCTCDCGETYWTPVLDNDGNYTPIKACPHCNICNPMILRNEEKLL